MLEDRRLLSGPPWAPTAKVVDQDLAAKAYKKITGKGQAVAILDTGVDYNHPALGGGWGTTVIGGYDFVSNDNDPMDQRDGTMVAGMIAARAIYLWRIQVSWNRAGGQDRGAADRRQQRLSARQQNRGSAGAGDQSSQAIQHHRGEHVAGDGDYEHKFTRAPYGDELATLKKMGVFINGGQRQRWDQHAGDQLSRGRHERGRSGSGQWQHMISTSPRGRRIWICWPPEMESLAPSIAGGFAYLSEGERDELCRRQRWPGGDAAASGNPKLNVTQILAILKSRARKTGMEIWNIRRRI